MDTSSSTALIVGLVALLAPAGAATQTNAESVLPLARLAGPLELDGMVDEPAWDAVEPVPMTVFQPTFGGTPTERTEIRIAYEDKYLWVSGRMYDSNPSGVRANTLYRDRYSGDDLLSILIDSFNDYETALWFSITPSGALTDHSVLNDGESTNFINWNWSTFWEGKARKTDDGWSAEMRIPLSSLGFQDDDGHVQMGMTVYRLIARKSERHVFPAIPPNWNAAYVKPSQAQRVSMEGIRSRNPTYFTPYGLGGLTRLAGTDNSRTNEVGVDIKYSPTSNLTLDLTANTDFAQVEADDQQVNLTRFSLFFPDKRQFFQERASTFEFNTGGQSRLFHSRRIGLSGGEPIRIFGGVRAVGRLGGTDLGVLNMQTEAANGAPSENFGVFRIRQQILNSYSNIGAIATTRAGDDGSYNVAAGIDGVIRPFRDEYLTLKAVQTFDDSDSADSGVADRGLFLARWERRQDDGFSYSVDCVRAGDGYDPGVGFIRRSDFTFLQNDYQYLWFAAENSPIRTVSIGGGAQGYIRNDDGAVESGSFRPSLQFDFKSTAKIDLSLTSNYESVRDTFALAGGAEVPAGDYWFHEANLDVATSRLGSFRPNLTVGAGSFYDGYRLTFSSGPSWNVSRHLELGGGYTLNVVRFNDRDVSLDTHLLSMRIQAALDIHLSLSTLAQYTSTGDLASVNARLRYHLSHGNDLWLVYGEGFNTDRDRVVGEPRQPLSGNRALMLKLTRTLIR